MALVVSAWFIYFSQLCAIVVEMDAVFTSLLLVTVVNLALAGFVMYHIPKSRGQPRSRPDRPYGCRLDDDQRPLPDGSFR
jgi:hypothetical protein